MIPDSDLQLRVVIKALSEVVAPAIDATDRVAIEQLQLSLATLSMLHSRLPLERRRVSKELAHAINLATATGQALGESPAILSAALPTARAALQNVDCDTANLGALRRVLLSAVSACVDELEQPALRRRIGRAVVVASEPAIELASAWCAQAGFEADPARLGSLDHLLD